MHQQLSRVRWLAAAILGPSLGLLTLFGCAPRKTTSLDGVTIRDTQKSPVDTAERSGQPPEQSSLPLDFVLTARGEFQVRFDAMVATTTRACASKVGIQLPTIAPTQQPTQAAASTGLFGLTDAARAATRGYLPLEVATTDTGSPNASLSADQNAVLDRELFGPTDSRSDFEVRGADGRVVGSMTLGDGCLTAAYDRFFGGRSRFEAFLTDDYLLQDAVNRSRDELSSSAAYRDLVGAWRKCMSEHGFGTYVGDAGDPFSLRVRDWPSPRPGPEEVRVATADVDCKTTVNFLSSATEVLSSIQTRLVEDEKLQGAMTELAKTFHEAGR